MGLDSVELVITFEEVFQISILNQEAEKLCTPRDVIECVVAKLGAREEDCAAVMPAREESTWEQLKNALLNSGMAAGVMSKEQCLDDVFADRSVRRLQWRQLKQQLQVKTWPGLRWLGLGKDFPAHLKTLGDLAVWIPRNNLQPLTKAEIQILTREDISLLVKYIVFYQIAVPEEKYGEDKRFVQDMGID